MGEYADYGGDVVKIGTCEDMYYLRYRQRFMVDPKHGNVNPHDPQECLSLRFRFPWPDEDNVMPGAFDNFDRSVAVHGLAMPDGVRHYNVQFRADAGYLLSLPCPESGKCEVPVHRNGFSGAVHLIRQKLLADGRLVPIMKCGGCGALWRLEGDAEIADLAEWFVNEGIRRKKDSTIVETGEEVGHKFWHAIAQRILDGAKMGRRELAAL